MHNDICLNTPNLPALSPLHGVYTAFLQSFPVSSVSLAQANFRLHLLVKVLMSLEIKKLINFHRVPRASTALPLPAEARGLPSPAHGPGSHLTPQGCQPLPQGCCTRASLHLPRAWSCLDVDIEPGSARLSSAMSLQPCLAVAEGQSCCIGGVCAW